jgi:hypothetical protein
MDGWEYSLKTFCGVKLVVHSHNMEDTDGKVLENGGGESCGSTKESPTGKQTIIFYSDGTGLCDKAFGLNPASCLTVSFGTELSGPYLLTKKKQEAFSASVRSTGSNPVAVIQWGFNMRPT